jgi:hypothetical protein
MFRNVLTAVNLATLEGGLLIIRVNIVAKCIK